MRFIGDIHGLYLPYMSIIQGSADSVQIGDFGFGFEPRGTAEDIDENVFEGIEGRHRFIRGNHDSPSEVARSSHWIPDGTVEDGIMYIGGATSIDKDFREEGKTWWPDEELSEEALEGMVDKYISSKPHIMVTHEVPEFLVDYLILGSPFGRIEDHSNTRLAFDRMLGYHKPEYWIFGHWHQKVDYMYQGTRLICLPELAYIDLET